MMLLLRLVKGLENSHNMEGNKTTEETHKSELFIFINSFLFFQHFLFIVFKFTRMYKYKNNISVFTIYYTSRLVYTH